MESTKIRALTQLCLELKQRRETLIEQWSSTQSYLDTKQQSLEHEFRALQQDNQMLFDNVEHLQKALGGFHSDWKDYLQQMLGLQRELRQLGGSYQELQQNFGSLHTEMRLIQQNIAQDSEADEEAKQAFEEIESRLQQQTQELQATYAKYQEQQTLLEKMYQQKSVQSEQVDAVKRELSGLQGLFQQLGTDVKRIYTEIEAYKTRWQADHEAQQNAFSHLRSEHEALSEQHQQLSDNHAELQALHAQKEAEYSASLARHAAYQTQVENLSQESVTALSALHEEHAHLQSDTQALLAALNTLQSRWRTAQDAQSSMEAAFAEQKANFTAQAEKLAELEAQGTAHLSRIHALESENKGYEADLYELSDLVDTQKEQLATQAAAHETQMANLTEAQSVAQEKHEAQWAELQDKYQSQQSEYEAKIEALEASQSTQQTEYEAKIEALEVSQSTQQTEYEAQLAALKDAQSEAQESHTAELTELQEQLETLKASQESQKAEYEAQLAALTEAQSAAQERHAAELAELEATRQGQQSTYEAQLAEHAQQAEHYKVELAQLAQQQQALEAQLAQQQQRLQGYTQGLRDIQEAYAQLVHQAQQSADATAPIQEVLDDLQERLEVAQDKASEQQAALQSTREALADAQAEQGRKEKLLAQLENYGEESETLKSAREELLQEIAQNTQRTESLNETLSELEAAQHTLTEEQQQLQAQRVQKQQDLQLAEQEMRQRQEQAEQLQAFIDAFGENEGGQTGDNSAATPAVANDELTRSLQARVQALEAEKARLADQIIVQEGELLKQSQELERLEHQDVLAPLEQGSQPHLDQVISEEVAQISSLLSELNFGGDDDSDLEDSEASLTDSFPVLDLPSDESLASPEPSVEPEPSPSQSQLPTVYVYTQKVAPTPDLRAQLEDYLSQYRHRALWGERPEQLQAPGAKGVIFLLTPEEKVDAAALQHVKQAKVAHIEHVMSNITRLKIAVLDAFIG